MIHGFNRSFNIDPMVTSPVSAPELVLIAGPNGSGKTTIVKGYVEERFPDWPRLNADNLLLDLEREWHRLDGGVRPSPIVAAQMIDDFAIMLAQRGSPFILETVLSSDKYKALIPAGRQRGLVFRLVYVTTESPDINIARVAQRVRVGGHGVPEDRIRSRWYRSMNNLEWFAARADRLVVVDNSGEDLRVLAVRHLSGPLEVRDTQHPAYTHLMRLEGTWSTQD